MDQMEPIVYFCREKIMSINADDVTNDLLMLIREKRDIIIDMKNTVYISSAALRCFLIAKKALKTCADCSLTFINVSDYIKQTFEVTGFKDYFKIE